MAGRVVIDPERCKGCGLCIGACPTQRIGVAKVSNRNGFWPAEANPVGCTGCARCATVCPDAAITVYRQTAVVGFKSRGRARKAVEAVREGP